MHNTRDDDGGLKLSSKALEALGEGMEKTRRDDPIIGMRDNFREVVQPLLDRWNMMWERADSEDSRGRENVPILSY